MLLWRHATIGCVLANKGAERILIGWALLRRVEHDIFSTHSVSASTPWLSNGMACSGTTSQRV